MTICFSETLPTIFRFVTLSLEIPEKQAFTLWNSTKLCDTPWKFQDQKPRPMEIPYNFLLNSPGNSTSFLIDPCNIRMHFLQYTWKLGSSIFYLYRVMDVKIQWVPWSWFFQGFLFQSIFFQGLNLHSYLFRGGRLKIFSGIIFFRGIKSTKIQFQGIYKSNNHSFQTYWFLKIWSSIHLYG